MILLYILFSLLCIGLLGWVAYLATRIKHLLKQQVVYESEITLGNKKKQQLQQELLSLQSKLRLAIEDPVTGLTGWQLFTDRLNQNIHEGQRYQFNMAVLYIDIDQFHTINDALGQHTGNIVLQEVAKRLQTCIRQVDSMTRLAKDTFVVLLTQLNKPETAALVVQRMLQSLLPPIPVEHHPIQVSACIGIAIFPTDGGEATELLKHAEQALQLAKEKGSQAYQFYQEKLHVNSVRELSLLTRLKGEFVASEFEIYYQPIMDMRTNTIFCMEAQLHWRHPELGLVRSQELSHYTEKLGKANAFTEWLLQKSCHDFCAWRKSPRRWPELLGIPLALSQLKNENFIYRISHVLREKNFKPEWLLFEIYPGYGPMSSSVNNVANFEKAFNMLKYLQIKLSMEKVGLNPFSLLDLQKIPLRYFKLSQALLYHGQNEQTTALVKAMMALADSLSVQLIIQDIESEQQRDFFNDLGCHVLQGPFIGAPLPAKEVTADSFQELLMLSSQG